MQETLTNVVRHSRAGRVVITQLVPEGGGYSAQINEIEVVGAATS